MNKVTTTVACYCQSQFTSVRSKKQRRGAAVTTARPTSISMVISCLTVFVAWSTTMAAVHANQQLAEYGFELLDSNHDGQLDKLEYQQGLLKLEAFLRQPLNTSSTDGGDNPFAALWSIRWPDLMSLDGFWKGFTSALAMILVTEIGDKTFFIAAILSMKHSRSAVFTGAMAALYVMTVISTAMGLILPRFLPRRYTHILGGVLFLYFGVRLWLDSRAMEAGRASDELEVVEEELLNQSSKKKADEEEGGVAAANGTNKARKPTQIQHKQWYQIALQAMTLTMLAEWGDRSQIATIALGAAKNPVGVTVGGCLGHTICTGLAVIGGRMIASRISEKTVSEWGGIVFLVFGLHSIFLES